jgi:hypothetical protein
MNGAMFNSASRTALIAAAGLLLGGVAMPSAKAADLGGNCCADLEERVAELEATTARKGNRKMSVTITGQVHKVVLWWDDGQMSKTSYGIDNRNSSTRFSILGEAKVTPHVKMGFELMFDTTGENTSGVTQFDPNGRVTGTWFGSNLRTGLDGASIDAPTLMRRSIFWIEDDKLGRVSVGHYEMAGAITTIDLGGISAGASASLGLVNTSIFLRGKAGQFYDVQWINVAEVGYNQPRQDEVRYDSPTWNGFIYTASISDDGSNWGTMLRYANEFNGYRLAAGIGYEHYGQVAPGQTCLAGTGTTPTTTCVNGSATATLNGYGPGNLANPAPNINAWGVGASVLHVPTGLFVQGHYIAVDYDQNQPTTFPQGGIAPFNGFWGQNGQGQRPADEWLVQGGITKNWFGLGNTAIFAEGAIASHWGAAGGPLSPSGRTYNALTTSNVPGATSVFGVTDTQTNMYGFGITQNVDAAATELYLDYRHFSPDITCSSTLANCTGAAATIGTVPLQKLQTEDFWAIIGGARMKF